MKKNMRETIRTAPAILLLIAIASSLSACSWKKNQREDVVIDTGRRAAVLSLQKSTLLNSGCRYDLILKNNLTVEIRDLTLHFTAYNEADDRLQSVTRGFFGIKPTLQQYVDIKFAFECGRIKRIEVGGFGRCIVGELKLRSAQPGSCLNLVDVLPSRIVQIIAADDE